MILSFQFSTIGSRPMVENLKKNVVAAENEKVLPPKRLFFFLFPVDSSSLVGNRKCHRLITTRSARERFCNSWLYGKLIDLLRRPRDSCHLVPSSFQSRYGGIHKVDWNSVTLSETLWARLLLWTIFFKLETICARPYSMSIYTLCRAEFEQEVKFKLRDT
jgi:hypothetical protein